MSRRHVPGALVRLARQPLRVGAVLLLCATALASAGVQSAASIALQSTIDTNWRGAYDILVTADDELAAVGGDLPPNALAGPGQGLGVDDWEKIAGLDGVDVAAPIGEILVPSLRYSPARLLIPDEITSSSSTSQAYRLTVTYATDDGLGERIVEQTTLPLVIDPKGIPAPTPEQLEACRNGLTSYGWVGSQFPVDRERYPALVDEVCYSSWGRGASANTWTEETGWSGFTTFPGDDYIALELPAAPQPITRITLIDPAAERELLGDEGSFLDPLVSIQAADDQDVDAVLAWAESAGDQYAATMEDMLARYIGAQFRGWPAAAVADQRRLLADNGENLDAKIRERLAGVGFTPLLISDAEVASLTLKIQIERFGETQAESDGYAIPEGIGAGGTGEVVGTSVGDVSGLLNPFSAGNENVIWPGEDPPSDTEDASPWNSLNIIAVGKGAPSSYQLTEDGLRLEPAGYASALRKGGAVEDALSLGADPEQLGAEAAYTEPQLTRTLGAPEEGASTALPIGSFDLGALSADQGAANYVPLGAYAPVGSTVVDGEHAGATMLPSMSGLGLVSPRTVAIGSIRSAELWSDRAPISSIRVRVGGIEGYTPEAQQRVLDVARSIEDSGYTATIVAGSSPRDVDVVVDGYSFGVDAAGQAQTVGSLGAVAQSWSELGAAARVELAVSQTAWTMLGIALAAGLLLLGATQLALIPGRRVQSVVLREIGFTRSRIVRWFAAEEVPGFLVVVAVAAVTWVLSGGTALAGIAALASVVILALTSAAAVHAGAQRRPPRVADRRSRRLGASSVTQFGLRQAWIHPLTSTVHLLAIVIVGVAAAALVETVVAGRMFSGESRLAFLAGAQQILPQTALGVVGVVGGVLLARITRRMDLARRSQQWSILRAAGWTRRQISHAQRTEGLAIVVPALVVLAAVVVSAAFSLGWGGWVSPLLIALAAGVASALFTFAARMRGTTT
ncbi:hypothetical protein [Microbacterium sp. PMB16]|uniref:hypothetical protein n=1 Tax=Microbacterium sp. PMB16 TaxID=3120157 RepID=UPI003F4C468F